MTYNNYTLGNKQQETALKKYNSKFNNVTYTSATNEKSIAYCIRLQYDAIALCGSPHYRLSNIKYSKEAQAFLQLFI